jgi:hypothetical protein
MYKELLDEIGNWWDHLILKSREEKNDISLYTLHTVLYICEW